MIIKVLLADDHEIFRSGLRDLIDTQPDMHVVAEADNGFTAVKLANRHLPHIVITDVEMPGLNGIEAARRIATEVPFAKVIALSMHCESRFVSGMIEAGVAGYLVKSCTYNELISAIRTVVSNHTYLSPEVAHMVVKMYKDRFQAKQNQYTVLSRREREVLQLLAEGKTARQTADLLSVSVKTVETHRRNVTQKLNIRTIAELTRFAIREGLVAAHS